jgi:leukotriene-A4 hydrolase
MSAIRQGEPIKVGDKKTHSFHQPVLIPSYLYHRSNSYNVVNFIERFYIALFRLAIVAGDLQSRQIGPRSHVWAEPAMLDKAAYEFAEVFAFFEYAILETD